LSPSGMVWWTTAEWVSSTRMMSTGPEASRVWKCYYRERQPRCRVHWGTRSGTCLVLGVKSPPSSGVARLLDGDPDDRTSSSMKSKAASSETAQPSELNTRSVLFLTTTRY
jgi:hypothetical protein